MGDHILKQILEGNERPNEYDLLALTRKGLSRSAVDDVARAFGLSENELCELLPISWRTLRRYQPDQLLNSHVTDHLICLVMLFARIVDVFGTPEKATLWVKKPNPALGDTLPSELLDTYAGIEIVRDCLIRIEHGVYN